MNGRNFEKNRKAAKEKLSDDNRPLVSFILLTYNQERFVNEAVEGALAQTYTPLEIIISDHCCPVNF
jgi:cellulose synthase/poly-beta-1,6-N-acetylglucosamine synthase-like glycosyltransferase